MNDKEFETSKEEVIKNLPKAETFVYLSTDGSDDFKFIGYGDPSDITNMMVSIILKRFPDVKETLFTMEVAGFAKRFLAEAKEDKKDSEEATH